MEFSDGMDFEAWNATVRSLASAVDKLERTVRVLAAPPWVERLLTELEELNLHLRRLDEAQLWLPQPGATPVTEANNSLNGADGDQDLKLCGENELEPVDGSNAKPREPSKARAQFGDPDAIARYGRSRRR